MFWLSMAHAEVGLSGEPSLGDEVTVSLTDNAGRPVQGATVRVIHRPDLHSATEVAVGITDARGEASWVPDTPGVATLIAGDEQLELAIAWDAMPTTTLIGVMLLVTAALTSAGYALRPSAP